jgi:carboxymethylenebutenolidase
MKSEENAMTFTVMIDGPDGSFGAYIAQPNQPNGAALVVIQEIFGVNAVMRELADHYASLGYVAIVPDLFWRIEPGISITDKTPEEMTKAFDLFGKFNVDAGIKDIQMTIDYARTLAPKVGSVGYCLGGLLAYLTSCRTNIDASVSFYGVSIEKYTDEAARISNPLMLHVASEDKFVSKEAQAVISSTAKGNNSMTLHLYEGLDHAFARPSGEHFDAEGAVLANRHTADFFKMNLLS